MGRPIKDYGYPSHTGGATKKNCQGYIEENVKGHPHAKRNGWVFQHRLVMESKIGRYLTRNELVHHIDHDKTNNHPDNLMIVCKYTHHKHHPEVGEGNKAALTEEMVVAALEGRTTKEAADKLGVGHMTLRRRFPHLLKYRISPRNVNSLEVVDLVRKYGPSDAWGYREMLRHFGLSMSLIQQICQKHSIEWVHRAWGGRSKCPLKKELDDLQTESARQNERTLCTRVRKSS